MAWKVTICYEPISVHCLLLPASALSFSFLPICLLSIRYVQAQGHSVDELPFRALGGIWGSLLGAFILIIVLIAQVGFSSLPQCVVRLIRQASSTLRRSPLARAVTMTRLNECNRSSKHTVSTLHKPL